MAHSFFSASILSLTYINLSFEYNYQLCVSIPKSRPDFFLELKIYKFKYFSIKLNMSKLGTSSSLPKLLQSSMFPTSVIVHRASSWSILRLLSLSLSPTGNQSVHHLCRYFLLNCSGVCPLFSNSAATVLSSRYFHVIFLNNPL